MSEEVDVEVVYDNFYFNGIIINIIKALSQK